MPAKKVVSKKEKALAAKKKSVAKTLSKAKEHAGILPTKLKLKTKSVKAKALK